jgi:hypothetical protein
MSSFKIGTFFLYEIQLLMSDPASEEPVCEAGMISQNMSGSLLSDRTELAEVEEANQKGTMGITHRNGEMTGIRIAGNFLTIDLSRSLQISSL